MKNKFFKLSIITLILALVFMTACNGKVSNVEPEEDKKVIEEEVPEDIAATPLTQLAYDEDIFDKIIGEFNIPNIEVPYNEPKIEASVEPYKVAEDLSNVSNLEKFKNMRQEEKDLLAKQYFFIKDIETESEHDYEYLKYIQMFTIYDKNDYNDIPSFITTDSIMHAFHIFYDAALRKIEEEHLIPSLRELTSEMLIKTNILLKESKEPKIKAALERNAAYYIIISKLLGQELPADLPEDILNMANEELKLIEAKEGYIESKIILKELDYSQFTVRGHYTRNKELENYFKAMMYLGLVPFEFKDDMNILNEDMTLSAMCMTYTALSDKEIYTNWNNIYDITSFFVGDSDDLGINEYGKILFGVYGNNTNPEEFVDESKFNMFVEELEKLEDPKIQAKYMESDSPTAKQFRFMGQRFVLDAEIIQNLVEPIKRPIPSGLDVMAALGSDKAKELQLADENNKEWDEYPNNLEKQIENVKTMDDNEWMKNMYTGWLWSVKSYLQNFEEGYPSFMITDEWKLRSLDGALASWAEIKHDTILYGKQAMAQMGDMVVEPVKGYVEPNIELYTKLKWLVTFSKENLTNRNMLSNMVKSSMDGMIGILDFLITASEKELNNEVLTEEEYRTIEYYGATLEWLMLSFEEVKSWFELESETSKKMPLIADFYTLKNSGYMEAAIGLPHEIYVLVPIEGELTLTRGAVFRYYEFLSKDKRYTDEEWQKELEEGKAPGRLYWQKDIYVEGNK